MLYVWCVLVCMFGTFRWRFPSRTHDGVCAWSARGNGEPGTHGKAGRGMVRSVEKLG